VALAVAFAFATPSAGPQSPPRDTARPVAAPTGTASISGRIVTDETPARPVRRAVVRVMASASAASRGEVVVTDDEGRFAITALAADRYSISVSKPGFVSATYGAKRPGGPGTMMTIAEGQEVRDFELRMVPGAAISGVVTDQNGDPAAQQTVSVMRFTFNQNGERVLGRVGTSGLGEQTDDRGRFRIWGLPPGEYVVLISQGLGRPGNTDVHQITPAEVQWATRFVQARGSLAGGAEFAQDTSKAAYAPVFYPGTPLQASAAVITLAAGEERAGVDVPMLLMPTAGVTGTIVSNDGPLPANFIVSLLSHERIEGLPFGGFNTSSNVRDGRFTFNGLTPGTYTIVVRPRPGLPAGARGASPEASPEMLTRFGMVDVAMNGVDQAVDVTLQRGVTVSGQLAFKGAAAPPGDLTRVRLTLSPVLGTRSAGVGVSPAMGRADGTFLFTGVAPGRYRFTASVPGSSESTGWRLRSAVLDGRDVVDDPVEIGANDVGNLAVSFTDSPAELSGTILDAAGRPTPEYTILVFAANPAAWGPGSRRVQQKRPSSDGRFVFGNLAPGDYLLAAVTDIEQFQWYDSSYLEKLAPFAIKIGLAEAEKKVQNIAVR
jgi:protocatechuate 3,4-dioxygenase beta subunit